MERDGRALEKDTTLTTRTRPFLYSLRSSLHQVLIDNAEKKGVAWRDDAQALLNDRRLPNTFSRYFGESHASKFDWSSNFIVHESYIYVLIRCAVRALVIVSIHCLQTMQLPSLPPSLPP